jgi:DNA-binding transcriptional ArsR family regulator
LAGRGIPSPSLQNWAVKLQYTQRTLNFIAILTKQELATFNKLINGKDQRLAIVFNALSDLNRCKIFRLILKQDSPTICVSDLAQILKISVPAVSQHLKILQITGLIQRERRGQKTIFHATDGDPLIAAIKKAIL